MAPTALKRLAPPGISMMSGAFDDAGEGSAQPLQKKALTHRKINIKVKSLLY
jgi:hypothetical protein